MASLKRVAIVVGEASGDILGAGLIEALQKRYPECEFEGIGGPRMCALGFHSLFKMDRLAVMGFVEPLKRLSELLSIRKSLRNRYVSNPPDVFIGIDAPDFNLTLEKAIRESGTPVVHYVSPSVWAWRKGRMKKIAKAVDLMLTLFPFEAAFYQSQNIQNAFVGHPLADSISMQPDEDAAFARLQISRENGERWIGLLPGSRGGEVEHLCETFVLAAKHSLKSHPTLKFLIPAANNARLGQINEVVSRYPEVPVKVVLGQSQDVMLASEAILIASGTATLEALLLKRPMVIAYKMAPLSYWLLSKLVTSKYVGLPNLLAERELVPELLQHAATPEALSEALDVYLSDVNKSEALKVEYRRIHSSLAQDASETAANAIVEMLSQFSSK